MFNSKKRNTVIKIVKKDLCVSCGGCKSICPKDAIFYTMKDGQYLPVIDEDKCVDCGLCLQVCPSGGYVGFSKVVEDVNKEKNYLSIICKTKNLEILPRATSGGVITTIIKALLSSKKYDCAFVVKNIKNASDQIFLEKIFNENSFSNTSGSKYCPVSAENFFEEVKFNSKVKAIIVATPCVLKAMRRFLSVKKISTTQFLFLGLFCDKTMNFNFLEYMQRKYSESDEKITGFYYRCKEQSQWPGNLKVFFDSGRSLHLPNMRRMEVKNYFQLGRCLYCSDKLNNNADISFGDCYISEEEDLEGVSNIIIRTDKGKAIWKDVKSLFVWKPVDIKKVEYSQAMDAKKFNLKMSNRLKKKKVNIELFSKKLKMFIGRKGLYMLIKPMILLERLVVCMLKPIVFIKCWMKNNLFIGIVFFSAIIVKRKTTVFDKSKKNVVIVGGELFNKGAQAMTFAVVALIKKEFADKKIYLFSERDALRSKEEKSVYSFNIRKWGFGDGLLQISKFLLFLKKESCSEAKKTREILNNTCFMIDVSGLALSSKFGWWSSLCYCVNVVVSKKYNVPFFSFPQSVGPFNYRLLYGLQMHCLLKIVLPMITHFYARESDGAVAFARVSPKNCSHAYDLVLQTDDVPMDAIYKNKWNYDVKRICKIAYNSVGIIPNARVLERVDNNVLFSFYRKAISGLLKEGVTIYLIRHAYEDLPILQDIKRSFKDNDRVIILGGDYSCIEISNIMSNLKCVIASRYHSVVHAYKCSVPAFVIGWAVKYEELLSYYGQERYYYDCQLQLVIDEMLNSFFEFWENIENLSFEIKKGHESLRKTDFGGRVKNV